MADRGISFLPSPSPDVVAYRLRLSESGTEVGMVEYPKDTLQPDPNDPARVRIDLQADPAWSLLDGTYDVDLRAVDDAGNESAPLLDSITVDFVRPQPPSGFATW